MFSVSIENAWIAIGKIHKALINDNVLQNFRETHSNYVAAHTEHDRINYA